ncbi:MAG: AAA family ATPase [Alphaproteobacteria bacterium]|nr:AAA family ATPase [Alphaproteobacteria bacterium]
MVLKVEDYLKDPINQDIMIGFSDLEKDFVSKINENKIDGSWLFTGPKGVGKSTFAIRLAKHLYSEHSSGLFGDAPSTIEISNNDEISKSLMFDSNTNIKIIGKALKPEEEKARNIYFEENGNLDFTIEKNRKRYNEIRIDDIRKGENFLRIHGKDNKKKVLIIDDAECMNPQAANALLKILEEPPANSIIILISHQIGKLLPTIKSRCKKVLFHTLSLENFTKFFEKEELDTNGYDISELYNFSKGSLGTALDIIKLNGIELYNDILSIVSNYPKIDFVKLNSLIDKVYKNNEQFELFQKLIMQFLSNLTLLFYKKDCQVTDLEIAIAQKILSKKNILTLMDEIQNINDLFSDIDLDRKQTIISAFSVLV